MPLSPPPVAVTVLPQALVSGPVTSTPLVVGPGVQTVAVAGLLADADAQDPGRTLTYQLQASYDGGQSFDQAIATGWQGGLDRAGQPCPPGLSWSPGRVPTHVRLTFNLPQPLSLGATVTLS
jgi:hypothetical protein